MAVVRFLDGKHAGSTASVDDSMIVAEGQYRFKGRDLTSDRDGEPYYLKRVHPTHPDDRATTEWTAALDADTDD